MVAIEHTYKGYEIHTFVRHFLDTDQWTLVHQYSATRVILK